MTGEGRVFNDSNSNATQDNGEVGLSGWTVYLDQNQNAVLDPLEESRTTDSTGRRVRDPVAWEAAIQQVLSACKEFHVPCGYPANDSTMMAARMKQGFSVFITSWGDNGFKAVDVGRKIGGR